MVSLQVSLEAAGLLGLLSAAVIDLKTKIIPNALVVWVFGAGSALRWIGHPWQFFLSLGFAVAIFAPLALLAYRGQIGGGDAKMIPATILLVEPHQALDLLLAIGFAGGPLTLYFLADQFFRRRAKARIDAAATVAIPMLRTELPYGLAIFAGAAYSLIRSV